MDYPHNFSTSGIALITALLGAVPAIATEPPTWDTRHTEEIRELIEGVLADADTRTSLQETDLTGGWDGHFFLASSDGNFRVEAGGQLQFRYMHSFRNDSNADDSRGGFQNRRVKLIFTGHVIDPSIEYAFYFYYFGVLLISDAYVK